MKRLFLTALAAIALPLAALAETRCGWFANPTPANYVLTDAHGSWWLAAQGTSGVEGFYDALDRDNGQGDWVSTNGSYGYGCACIDGAFGPRYSGEVYSVFNVQTISLGRCVADPALPSGPFQ